MENSPQSSVHSAYQLEPEFLIWSFEHDGWWGIAERGYTQQIGAAGKYTLEHATEICRNANAHGDDIKEAMVPINEDGTYPRQKSI